VEAKNLACEMLRTSNNKPLLLYCNQLVLPSWRLDVLWAQQSELFWWQWLPAC